MSNNNENYKNVRITNESFELLKEIRFYTDETYVNIVSKSVKDYQQKLIRQGIIKK
ncbi:hypothetical protein [Mammaliicoccus sciuri]|uniref:hypothetical protein n=1 Tax=Mammaliicoccus sciuri TaxID=1296 RepID=UPI001553C0A8|nr:hypothetical protein [Mammaliicoccus sciuri]